MECSCSNTRAAATSRGCASVEVGEMEGSEIQIMSGVAAGDTVITTGAALVKDGARVEVLK